MAAAANNNNNNNNTRFNDIYLIKDYDPTTFIGPNYTKINDIEIISNRPNEFYVSSFMIMIYNAYDNNQIIIVIHKPKLLEHNKSSRNILLEIHPTTIELLQSQHLYNTGNHIDKIKQFFTSLDAGKSMAIVFATETEPELDYINNLIKECQDTIYNSKIIVNNSNNNKIQARKKTSTRLAKSSISKRTRLKLNFNSKQNRRSRNNNSAMKKVFISRSTFINLYDPNNTVFYDQETANREIDEQSGYMNVNPDEENGTFRPESYHTPISSRTARNGSTITNSMRPLPDFVRMGHLPNNGEVVLTPPRTAEPVAIAPAAPAPAIGAWTSTPTPATPTQPA